MTEIFEVKISLLPERMNDIFKFVEKLYSLQKKLQFKPEDPNHKIWHRNIENMA